MQKSILIATENQGKIKEIKEIFLNTGYDVHFLPEFRDKIPDLVISENAQSFEGNALIKAIVIGEALDMITMADDSGLCIDALGGKPGVKSARYVQGSDADRVAKILEEMKDIPRERRTAYYCCVVAIYNPEDKFVATTEGIWSGLINEEARGAKSFGYAPIFLAADFAYTRTNAECDPEEVININHRGKAFRASLEILKTII